MPMQKLGGPNPRLESILFLWFFQSKRDRNFDQYAQLVEHGRPLVRAVLGSTTPLAFGRVQRNEFVYNYALEVTGKRTTTIRLRLDIWRSHSLEFPPFHAGTTLHRRDKLKLPLETRLSDNGTLSYNGLERFGTHGGNNELPIPPSIRKFPSSA